MFLVPPKAGIYPQSPVMPTEVHLGQPSYKKTCGKAPGGDNVGLSSAEED